MRSGARGRLSGRRAGNLLARRDAGRLISASGTRARASEDDTPAPLPGAAGGDIPVRIAVPFFVAAFVLVASRMRRSFRLPKRDELRQALGLALILLLSRLRRWRKRLAPFTRLLRLVRSTLAKIDRALLRCVQWLAAIVRLVGRGLAFLVGWPRAGATVPHYRRPPEPRTRLRKRGWGGGIFRRLTNLMAVGIGAAAGGAAFPVLIGWMPYAPLQRPEILQPAPQPVASAALASTPRPDRDLGPAERPQAKREPYRIVWPYDITDALTFGPDGGTKTRLADLEAPTRDSVCNDADGRAWACGLQARAMLNNVTRRVNLVCEPVAGGSTDPIAARCRGEVDIAREMVLAGFARPTVRSSGLDGAEDEARRNKRGLWNGGWTIRQAAK